MSIQAAREGNALGNSVAGDSSAFPPSLPPPLFGVAGLGSGVPSLCWAPLALPGGGEKYTAGVGFGTESERGQEEEPGGVRCALSSGSFALTSCLPGAHSFIQPVCLCVSQRYAGQHAGHSAPALPCDRKKCTFYSSFYS